MISKSVLNKNTQQKSVLNTANKQYEKHANAQSQQEMNNYINQSQETSILKDIRITDMPKMSTDGLDETYINTEEVLNKAGELTTLNQNMVDEFSKVIQNMSNLENDWSGSSSGNTMAAFNIIKEHINTRSVQMNNYIELLKQVIVSGYEETETSNNTLADAFK